MRKLLVLSFLFLSFGLRAQDFNAQVQVLHNQIQTPNTQIFKNLEISITEFLNNKKWAKIEIGPQERVDFNLIVNVTKYELPDIFQATLSLRASRPVFGSGYNTITLNHEDNDFSFTYVNFQQMIYNENSFDNNLTSVLGFYANMVMGMHFDTYSPLGGQSYFESANNVLNSAQSANAVGWNSTDGRNNLNRYWMVENALNARFVPMRQAIYNYHRKGLDIMYKDLELGRTEITNSLKELQKVSKAVPNSMYMRIYFQAKADEIVKIYTKALETDKIKVIAILKEIDPGNSSKWDKIQGN
ncbi:MAG: DUF4835 family protein [Bacteroidetes bacterium]|nr:MAG: DUF4835 family protein [Bacteroidota bacterium]